MSEGRPNDKTMRLRYAGVCRICGTELPAGTAAIYERAAKTVRCATHDTFPASSDAPRVDAADEVPLSVKPVENLDIGTPGASARREFERRKAGREQRVRTRHPRIGGFLHAISDEPQSTTAWNTGALGEERLGNRLNELASERLKVLHDRRIPGTRANIDHLAVTPTGVYVIDAKKYDGRPHLRVEGGLLRPRVEKLLVGSRDCTKLVDGVLKQVDLVRSIVGDDASVRGVLCFVEADWPLFGGSFTTRGVSALWPKKLYPQLGADGPLDVAAIAHLHRQLAEALAPA